MHKNPWGRDKRARERGPHGSQEQVEILKELETLMAARTTRGRPGRASVAVQQCMTQFTLYSNLKMTPQEVNRVANLPEWTTVLDVMLKSRRADLAFTTTSQERWDQRAQDRPIVFHRHPLALRWPICLPFRWETHPCGLWFWYTWWRSQDSPFGGEPGWCERVYPHQGNDEGEGA